MKKPGVLLGALVAFLLTLPLLAVLYVGNQIAGFPFVPFSFFNNVRDFTPGFILIPSIEAMKDIVIALNIGRTDTVAKIAEEVVGRPLPGHVMRGGTLKGAKQRASQRAAA